MSDLNHFWLIIRPRVTNQGLAGQIISKIKTRGFDVGRVITEKFDRSTVDQFYAHVPDQYREKTCAYMSSDNSTFVEIKIGKSDDPSQVIEKMRLYVGVTDPTKADHGTLRREYSDLKAWKEGNPFNAIHRPANVEEAEEQNVLLETTILKEEGYFSFFI